MAPKQRRILALLLFALRFVAGAQAPGRFVGTVQAIRADQGEIDVKPDQGNVRMAKLVSETVFQRVAPGEKDLKQARPIQLADVAVGDRVLIALEPGTDNLRRLVVMSASDIARRNEAERLDWQRRGISGIVTARQGNEVTLKMRSMTGETQAVVVVGGKTAFHRYAPDSVRFADASSSNLSEISVGDQLRARGEKSGDGLKVIAEEVVFGTFLTKAGKISAVDVQSRTITVSELNTNKPLLIRLTADSQLKAMPDFSGMGAGGGLPAGPTSGPPSGGMPAGRPPGALPGAPGGPMGGMRPPDIAQMLEHMPSTKLEDLKPGETIVVSSTKGASSGEITAITLVTNAGMLVQMATFGQRRAGGPQGSSTGAANGAGMMGGMQGALDGMQLPGIVP